MICGTFRITSVPADQVVALMQEANASTPKPLSVTSTPDDNGQFTILSVYPPCPTNVVHEVTPEPRAGNAVAPTPAAGNAVTPAPNLGGQTPVPAAEAHFSPLVVDISHHVERIDFSAVAEAGVIGVIAKATQGTNYTDPTYAVRRGLAKAAGLLWGAYHFCENGNVSDQVQHFLTQAAPGPNTLLVVDFEKNPQDPTNSMSLPDMVAFLGQLEDKTKRKPVIYGGAYLKEALGAQPNAALSGYRLWWAEYGPTPKYPGLWPNYWLWQYTDGKSGPQPRSIAGITEPCDLNYYSGAADDLRKEWIS
ncbi:GH25 family lysozyme [Labrys okinawensis]|uniref:GH25 family lysozyme n=1 Tax=Labrys okinawensis TaxID=346911 RepID=UPI0039BC8E87